MKTVFSVIFLITALVVVGLEDAGPLASWRWYAAGACLIGLFFSYVLPDLRQARASKKKLSRLQEASRSWPLRQGKIAEYRPLAHRSGLQRPMRD